MQPDPLTSYFHTVFNRRFVELRLSDGEVLTVSRQWWRSFLSELDEKPSSEQVFRDTRIFNAAASEMRAPSATTTTSNGIL